MNKIYSTKDPQMLLHSILKKEDILDGKIELSDPKEYLQIMAIKDENGKNYPAHKHLWKDVEPKSITQESWIVIQGKLKGIYYDTDGTKVGEEILGPGDCSITFYGGHSVDILEEGTIFYEIKTGPYLGKEYDKAPL